MIGTTLAHYEILSKLGEGGMGEVWKARDTALNREVAIKILPEIFAQDPDRRARFEREARLLAQLNHPGIAAVHGLHEDKGVYFLAMELVPGEDLAHRLAQGPLPVDEALKVGARVAEALEAAHEQGVIHRDLKPSNIVLMPGGAAKVLDFGLAKSVDTSGDRDSSLSASPTITTPGTLEGVILGTAAYMSPEQSRGKMLDRRTDIWSFGCVLYECLTGKALFKGETVSDTIGAILHKDPDWNALPAGTPAPIVLLLKRCLNRDPDHRLRDIGDARIEIGQALQDPTGSYLGLSVSGDALAASPARRGSRWVPALVLGAIGIGLGIVGGLLLRPAPEPAPLRKLDLGVVIEPPQDGDAPARISPDGTKVVFTHKDRLWVQFLDELEPHPLEETETARGPVWSPDGTQIAYFKGTKLWRIPATGGRSVAICDMGATTAGGYGAVWAPDGRIVYSRGNTGVFAVPALGGEPKEIYPLGEGDGDFHEPGLLPGGNGLLFVLHPEGAPPNVLCAERDGERKILMRGEGGERFWRPVHSPAGFVLFRRTGGSSASGIWGLPFDAASLEVTGEAFLVAPDAASPSLSADGTLAFVNGVSNRGGNEQLAWVDRAGQSREAVGDTRVLGDDLAFSPDGRFLAFNTTDQETQQADLWVRDMERGTETRITNNRRMEWAMMWSGDGREIFYSEFFSGMTVGTFVFWRVPADGSGEPVQVGRGAPTGLDHEANALIVTRPVGPDSMSLSSDMESEIVRLPLDGSGEAEPVLHSSDVTAIGGPISPDGGLIAYVSRAPGREEVFVSRYPEGTGRWQVSINGGEGPKWDPRGGRLYYYEGSRIMEVPAERSGSDVTLGRPSHLFDLPSQDFTPSPDGERFLVVSWNTAEDDQDVPRQIGVKIVADWMQEFKKR